VSLKTTLNLRLSMSQRPAYSAVHVAKHACVHEYAQQHRAAIKSVAPARKRVARSQASVASQSHVAKDKSVALAHHAKTAHHVSHVSHVRRWKWTQQSLVKQQPNS
jgi:hypothetical protein